jgi:transcriptional regulator with XRE-family HTH domain
VREERGRSIGELAAATSLHPDSLARMESGRTEPTLTMLVTLAQGLGVSVASIVEQASLDATTEA